MLQRVKVASNTCISFCISFWALARLDVHRVLLRSRCTIIGQITTGSHICLTSYLKADNIVVLCFKTNSAPELLSETVAIRPHWTRTSSPASQACATPFQDVRNTHSSVLSNSSLAMTQKQYCPTLSGQITSENPDRQLTGRCANLTTHHITATR
jgi:hypothetical protein